MLEVQRIPQQPLLRRTPSHLNWTNPLVLLMQSEPLISEVCSLLKQVPTTPPHLNNLPCNLGFSTAITERCARKPTLIQTSLVSVLHVKLTATSAANLSTSKSTSASTHLQQRFRRRNLQLSKKEASSWQDDSSIPHIKRTSTRFLIVR